MSNFSFTKIDVPDPAGSYLYISADGVDAAGEAVGNYGNVDGDGDGDFHGFVTDRGVATTYDPPGSTNTEVVGVTPSGEIFGDYVDNMNRQHGFVDNNGTVTTIDIFLAKATIVSGVNDSGVIYGSFVDGANGVAAFVDDDGNYSLVDAPGALTNSVFGVNASGQIAGSFTDAASVLHGFVDNNGTFTTIDPAGSISTSLVGISDGGLIVGNYQDSGNNDHGFVFQNGVVTTIDIPGATSMGVQAINAAGEFVGYFVDGSGNIHGFIDDGGVVTTEDIPGATETDIIGVSTSGVISGYFDDAGGQHAFVGTPAPTVIESDGSTSLTELGGGYYLTSGGAGPELKFGGSPVVPGQFAGIAPIGAEQISGGYEVAWKVAGTGQFGVWTTDSNGNYLSNIGLVSGNSSTLETLETSFHQDLNGDGVIGIPVIESAGSTSLIEVGGGYYFTSGGVGPEFRYGGSPVVVNEFPGDTPIGVEATATGYEVAWKVDGTDQFGIWTTDSNGNYLSNIGLVSGNSSTLETLETSFHQDLNGDGVIGIPVIESAGSTSLIEVGGGYYLTSGGIGPELRYGGSPVVVNEFPGDTPIGVEATATGYEVAWKVDGTDQFGVWTTDSNGNYQSNIGLVSGTSSTLETLETSFHQDLNGDGVIGIPVIESAGSTSLTEVGGGYYLTSGGIGPELRYGGSPVVVGEFAGDTPIGAEQTSTGYEVAWKVDGTDQFGVWTTDSNGNYLSNIGLVSAASSTLESAEANFYQDLNGDGVIDLPTTVIEATGDIVLNLATLTQAATIDAAATLELTGADTASVTFNGATGSLILDHSVLFSGEVFNFTGDGNLASSDQVDLRDIAFGAGTTGSYTGTSSGGTLTVSDGQNHTAHIALAGDYTNSTFSLSSDGSGGTAVIDPPLNPDAVKGTLAFGDTDPADTHSVSAAPQNGGAGYLGNFTVDAVDGQDAVGWHFNFDSASATKTVTQMYDVAVTDNHADGTHSSATQSVSVTIAGPGNDAFVFHPGVGSETIVHAGSADTIELDGFSAVTNGNQLAQLLSEAQAGQPQPLFTAANGGRDMVISLGHHDSITLTDVQLSDLHASYFLIH